MNKRDILSFKFIMEHYNELMAEFIKFSNYEEFQNNITIKKAIVFDFIQIGENVNKLSEEVKKNK